jgi:hypothetical protein
MKKIFMILGALSKGRKPERDPGIKYATPIPGQAAVTIIFG